MQDRPSTFVLGWLPLTSSSNRKTFNSSPKTLVTTTKNNTFDNSGMLALHRSLTLYFAPCISKTTLALHAAHRQYRRLLRWAELFEIVGLLSFLIVDKCEDLAILFLTTCPQGHLRFQDGGWANWASRGRFKHGSRSWG